MNRVIMMGRIVNDPELKSTPTGALVCSFRIAVDRNFQKKGDERKSDFFNVVAWRGTAEFIHNWFAKGRMIMIEGELQTNQYTDKNGNPSTWYEIVVDNAYFTGEKAANTPNSRPGSYQQGGYPQGNYQQTPPPYGEPPAQSSGSSAPPRETVPAQNSGGGRPSDFSSADDDNYPF